MARPNIQAVNQRIAANLKTLRQARGLTQRELADLVGVSYQQVFKYESGANRLSLPAAIVFAEALGVTLAELAGKDLVASPFPSWRDRVFYESYERINSTKGKAAIRTLVDILATPPTNEEHHAESLDREDSRRRDERGDA